ncbi:MAG: BrnA antitoxin family protein, partial [Alphaproteobacteria bacterium]|nr:BrnA antitoxin family protein [Alphaproteobacteria bacterium]
MEDIWNDITIFIPREKQLISIRLDREILDFFKQNGNGYQGRINSVLKSFIAHQKQKTEQGVNEIQLFKVSGKKKLHGQVKISGSTYSAATALAASLWAESPTFLRKIPYTTAIQRNLYFFEELGINVSPHQKNSSVGLHFDHVENKYDITDKPYPDLFLSKLLSAIPLLGRSKKIFLSVPARSFNHIQILSHFRKLIKAFGAEEKLIDGTLRFTLKGRYLPQEIDISKFSDSPKSILTLFVLLIAVRGDGVSKILNASFSPTVNMLCELLVEMGGKIDGLGSSTLTITGVKKLKGRTFKINQNSLEANFYALLAASTRSYIRLTDINLDYMEPILNFLEKTGVKILREKDSIEINASTTPLSL